MHAIVVVYIHIYSAPPLPPHTPSAHAARGVQWRSRSERTLAPKPAARKKKAEEAEDGAVWKRAEAAFKNPYIGPLIYRWPYIGHHTYIHIYIYIYIYTHT